MTMACSIEQIEWGWGIEGDTHAVMDQLAGFGEETWFSLGDRDIALHVASGFLLGIFGFLLIYVLNENKNVNMSMKPRFIALFAFVFSVAIGAIWEIFEYTTDYALGANMQKPMLGDPTGLTDTMWDLIVDTIGAAAIAGLGWWHMERNRESFVDAWIHKFIEKNPDWFRR